VADGAVLSSVKRLFIRSNWALYKCMHPGITKYKLRKLLSAQWNELPPNEMEFYISQATYILNYKEI
jgi:hypothetical protein